MQTNLIQRHYDDVIAPHYDQDPQSVLRDSLTKAVTQLRSLPDLPRLDRPLRVLDVGMGTGNFLQMLRSELGVEIEPYGLDLSQSMVEIARERIPDLTAVVDDASRLEDHFPGETFDLVSTHFMTGFVPVQVLAPQVFDKLRPGGLWSAVGGTMAGFPELQKKANNRLLRLLLRAPKLDAATHVTNPEGTSEVVERLTMQDFIIEESETFRPELNFPDFDAFMTFAHRGGWLTGFVESIGLHEAGAKTRKLLNTLAFPCKDWHDIFIVLGRKPE